MVTFILHPRHNYRQIYYEALDLVIESINSRFNQPGYNIYRNVEDLVLNACRGCPYDTELSNVCDFYKDDISKMQLQAQLPLLQALFAEEKNQSELSINDFIIKSLSQLSSAQRLAFSNVWVLMKILLVMPATNASSEHSFSGLRRIKTYLRTTMTQKRLNDLMVLNIHKEKTDLLNLAVVAKEFVSSRENSASFRH